MPLILKQAILFCVSALLEFSSVDIAEVRIRGIETNLYLAMNSDGRLYGEVILC